MAKRRPVISPDVWAELGIRAPRWKQNNIGNPSQKGRSVTHFFSVFGNSTHSVKGTAFSTFYSCVHIFPGLCILATKGTLAIVTVILIANICLSGTLFLFVWGFYSIAEWWRSECEVSGLAAKAWSYAALPITTSLFSFLSHNHLSPLCCKYPSHPGTCL